MKTDIRAKVANEVRDLLSGPIYGSGEELDKNPLDFYTMGILFPRLQQTPDFDDDLPEFTTAPEVDEKENFDMQELAETDSEKRMRSSLENSGSSEPDELELTTKFRPSAAGISVLTKKNPTLTLNVKFGFYTKKPSDKTETKGNAIKKTIWKHQHHSQQIIMINGITEGATESDSQGKISTIPLGERAVLSIVTRPYRHTPDLEIKTFTLINKRSSPNFRQQKKTEDCLFQPEIAADNAAGFESFEDLTNLKLLSKEDLNLKLLYRNYKTWALGHGISVDWDENDGLVKKARTAVMPAEKVNGVDLNPEVFHQKNILYIKRLAGKPADTGYSRDLIKAELEEFVKMYQCWIENQYTMTSNDSALPEELRAQALVNLKSCTMFAERMNNGIKLLFSDPEAEKAFQDANRAMFMQRVMADFSRHRREMKRVQHNKPELDDDMPDYRLIPFDTTAGGIWNSGRLDIQADTARKGTLARWRPFQLAFLLSQIEGITDKQSADRDTVDLIWFPTGGGKTEAYLGLTAFTIFYRRLKFKKTNSDHGAGVSVLMRYTLRLLNKQQFERASIMICACDLIRRNEPENYGSKRISNGIWMGSSMTPNKIVNQVSDYGNFITQINSGRLPDSHRTSPPLLSCPCCGNRLVKENLAGSVTGRWGYFRKKNSRNVETGAYLIGCTNTLCYYHVSSSTLNSKPDHTLPVYEVDEVIYEERPSLLFSTVDKFVQLAWNSTCFNLFNTAFTNGNIQRVYPSPDLIIQDELHLISSALGTIYGVYEIVVDRMCREAGGNIAKVVAATATVRNAAQQCHRLYGRNGFMQFPPPGIDADDSFYAKKIKGNDPKNRLYIGLMPSGTTTSTALIRLVSVLMERIPAIPESNKDLDNYYTLIVYFNALKELGRFRTFLTDDIVAYRKLLANEFKTFIRPFDQHMLCELSSVMTSDEITTGLDKLEKTTLPGGADQTHALVQFLYKSGIRSFPALRSARGSRWNDELMTEKFFKDIGLEFTDDSKKNYNELMALVAKLMPGEDEPVQIAPATNMISVGMDIPRLNTMIINGQPKTSAEYIQASSRVGREIPGIVFTFLSPTKNRDRSHYEKFKAFHQAYYSYVESSSVTPFSRPALEKVLPTVLIALTKSLFLDGNDGIFDGSGNNFRDFVDDIMLDIINRGTGIYGQAAGSEIARAVNDIKEEFLGKTASLPGNRRLAKYMDFLQPDPLGGGFMPTLQHHTAVYNAPSQFVESVLSDHIPTMQTLRNVEVSSAVSIKNQ